VSAARVVLPEGRSEHTARFDVAGAVLATTGLVGLVYGLVTAAESRWRSLPALLVAAVLLAVFARLQVVRPHALIPIRLLRNRTVLDGDVVGLLLGAAIYALFYFLSLFMGAVLGYGPIATGLAFIPMTIGIAAASAIAGSLLPRIGVRAILVTSALLTTLALVALSRISPDSSYPGTLLPALVLAGVGLGLAFVALTTAAVGSAPDHDSGIAAALFSAGQQIGGALGLAVLTAVSIARTTSLTAPGSTTPALDAVTQGWSLGFIVAAGFMLTGLLITVMMIRPNRTTRRRQITLEPESDG
jgi:predicted MFS family arabinose efflux permease